MIKINQIKLPVTHSDEALKKKIIKMLKLNAKTGFTYRILKKSLDARKKPELFYTYSVAVEIEDTKNSEEAIVKRAASSSVLIYKEKEYMIPVCGHIPLDRRPVIAGAGPAGLFCAYILAVAAGLRKEPAMYKNSGIAAYLIPKAMYSLVRAVPEPFQTAS